MASLEFINYKDSFIYMMEVSSGLKILTYSR